MSTGRSENSDIQALVRGLQVLESFSEGSPSLRLVDISAATGLPAPVVFRFVKTLLNRGYLQRDPETKRYRPGIGVLRLGFAFLNGMELTDVARPFVMSMAESSGELAELAVRDWAQVVTIVQSKSVWQIGGESKAGARQPVYCTALGKAQLTELTREELQDLLGDGPYPAHGPKTLRDLDTLVEDLDLTRTRGYAVNDEELAPGFLGVAAPVRGKDGRIMAGLGLWLLRSQADDARLHRVLAPLVVDTVW